MTDYSKMSDFEINCEVAKVNKWTSKSFVHEIHSGKWNPCQNPADAWPIILNNRISIVWDCAEDASAEWWNAFDNYDECRVQYQSNALRAAMLVFLMMQDEKHG